jgi:predicted PurR-regulated permease PerM
MKVKIDIETKTFVRFWLVIIALVLLGVLLYNAASALVLVGIAAFAAIALSKPVAWIARRLPGNSRLGATAISFLLMVALIVTIIYLVVPPIISQTVKLADNFPGMLENAKRQWSGLAGLIQQYNLQPQIDQGIESFRSNMSSWAANIGSGFITGVGSVIVFFVNLFIVLTLAFLMLLEGERWVEGFWSLYRDKKRMEKHRSIVTRMYHVTTNYVNGQVAIAAIGAMFAGFAVVVIGAIFGTPMNLAFPVIAMTFVLTMIPMFGSTIAGVLGSLLLILNAIPAGITYAIYFLVYQQIENNFIAPLVQSKTMSLSPLAILTAATVGTYMLGIAGGIIAIPIAGCIAILIDEYQQGTFGQPSTAMDDEAKPRPFSRLLKRLQKNRAVPEEDVVA